MLSLALLLSLTACQAQLDPSLFIGDYEAHTTPVQASGAAQASGLTLTLKLGLNGQAVYFPDTADSKAPSQQGLWSVSGDQLTLTLLKDDKMRRSAAMVDTTLTFKAKRSSRSLWLGELEFKKR